MKTGIITFAIMAVIALIGGAIGYQSYQLLNQPPEQPQILSGIGGSPYNATSTGYLVAWTDRLLQTGYGTLGSYIVTGANTTQFDILDATTTNRLLRTGQKATSTILIASIPASLAVGTYTFDAVFTDGLYIDVITAGIGTSTLTWK